MRGQQSVGSHDGRVLDFTIYSLDNQVKIIKKKGLTVHAGICSSQGEGLCSGGRSNPSSQKNKYTALYLIIAPMTLNI